MRSSVDAQLLPAMGWMPGSKALEGLGLYRRRQPYLGKMEGIYRHYKQISAPLVISGRSMSQSALTPYPNFPPRTKPGLAPFCLPGPIPNTHQHEPPFCYPSGEGEKRVSSLTPRIIPGKSEKTPKPINQHAQAQKDRWGIYIYIPAALPNSTQHQTHNTQATRSASRLAKQPRASS